MNQTTTDHLVTERTSTITPLETPSIFECAQKTRWASNFADDVFTLHERQQGVIILHILAVLYALSNSNLSLLLKINFFLIGISSSCSKACYGKLLTTSNQFSLFQKAQVKHTFGRYDSSSGFLQFSGSIHFIYGCVYW